MIPLIVGICGGLCGLFGIGFGVWQYRKRNRDTGEKERATLEAIDAHEETKQLAKIRSEEDRYRDVLHEELGTIRMLGLPELESVPVTLLNVFVDLCISDAFRTEHRFADQGTAQPCEEGRDLKPAALMKRAFERYRMLLIIGDPGSGKTTLLKYYAMCCLDPSSSCGGLGLPEHTLPIYFPLRDLLPINGEPGTLAENLVRWAKSRHLDIEEKTFNEWLKRPSTLVLLDGLDEVSDIEQRRRVCEWIDHTHNGLVKARFVLTSRWTGYRKLDGIELACEHLRADVKEFSIDQQEEFLQKWFREAFCRELAPEGFGAATWRNQQEKKAAQRAGAVIEFLKREGNDRIRGLSAVPMLLQIMAIIWKEREFLIQSRNQLYDVALDYLLEYRDRRRKLFPLLPAALARRALSPVALWMQEELHRDEAPKVEMHKKLKEVLDTMDKPPEAEAFCENLRDRAGVIADCGRNDYIFRHKSLREYLSARQIRNDYSHEQDRIERLAAHFGDDWWEEPIRFFINAADQHVFNDFIAALFRRKESRDLDQRGRNLLETIVREAPQKKIDALRSVLISDDTTEQQKHYALDCLKIIGTTEALKEAENTAGADRIPAAVREHAADIAITGGVLVTGTGQVIASVNRFLPFRNRFEFMAEYLPIPGGTFKYSISEKEETVPDIYFAKYPVTNMQYGQFIDYLSGRADLFNSILPLNKFSEVLSTVFKEKGKGNYLSNDRNLANIFRSRYVNNKRFNNPNQPVVGVNWYDATAYCLWSSMLDLASTGQTIDFQSVSKRFRLPSQVEWKWAAVGRGPGNTVRKYPWPDDLGKPTADLANFGNNVGASTPVGRYPKGATPEGLMDMAGNVWEWCAEWLNWEWKDIFKGSGKTELGVLCGGSWNLNNSQFLNFALLILDDPGNRRNGIGFRCVCSRY